MPIPIRYTTTNVSNSVRLGNIALGVNAVEYGPSSTTSWAGGVSVSTDGYDGEYAIHYLSGTTPRVRKADTFNLTQVAGQILGTSTYASTPEALSALAAAGCTVINTTAPPNIVTSGSVFNSDSGLIMSYPRINTTWYDISGNANNSTLTNGPTFDSTSNSLVFDGTNDYVNGPAISSQLTGDMTAEGWFKVTAGSGDWVRVIGTGGNSGNRTFGLWYLSTSNYILWQRLGGSDPAILITQPLTNGKWYYFAATTIGSSHVLYLNNQVMGTATAAGPWAASGENITMGYAGFHAYINGNISRGRLYNRGLSSSEIAQNYYQGNIVTNGLIVALDASNLVSYPGSGTTWYDMSGNNNNATLANGVAFKSANGGIFDFDGADDYAYISDNSTLDLAGDKSQCIWLYMDQSYSGTGILGKANSSVFGMALTYGWGNGGSTGFQNIAWNSVNDPSLSPNGADINNWYYVVGVQSGGTRYIYVLGANGLRTASYSGGTHTWNNALDFTIGQVAGYYTNMKAGAVHVYNRALSQEEIIQNFNAQRNRFNL
jgi:hypothetical protein